MKARGFVYDAEQDVLTVFFNGVESEVSISEISGRLVMLPQTMDSVLDGTFPVTDNLVDRFVVEFGCGYPWDVIGNTNKVLVDRDEYNYLRGVKECLDVLRKSES